MATDLQIPTVPPDVQADLDAVIAALSSGKPLDPVIARRVQERSARIREDVMREHGLLDIGVPAIRELRGEIPA